MKPKNCMCGETTLDDWCTVHGAEPTPRPCPTCHGIDNMRAHGLPCFYCGQAIDNLGGNPSRWSLVFPQPDGTGICRNYHVACVAERLRNYDAMLAFEHVPVTYAQKQCSHNFVPTSPEFQRLHQSSGVACEICEFNPGGWYCPDSPNHLCEYTSDYDSCDYCSQPDERK